MHALLRARAAACNVRACISLRALRNYSYAYLELCRTLRYGDNGQRNKNSGH